MMLHEERLVCDFKLRNDVVPLEEIDCTGEGLGEDFEDYAIREREEIELELPGYREQNCDNFERDCILY